MLSKRNAVKWATHTNSRYRFVHYHAFVVENNIRLVSSLIKFRLLMQPDTEDDANSSQTGISLLDFSYLSSDLYALDYSLCSMTVIV